MHSASGANGAFAARRDTPSVAVARRASSAESAAVAFVPLVLYLMGAGFLAVAALLVLDAKVVRPADRREDLARGAPSQPSPSINRR